MTFRKILSTFFNQLKTNKNKVFILKSVKYLRISSILNILQNYGIIYSFLIKDSKIHISCNQSQSLFIIKYINKVKYLSFYKLKSLICKYPSSIFVISTNLGVLDNSKIFNLKIGGYLLFIIKPKIEVISV